MYDPNQSAASGIALLKQITDMQKNSGPQQGFIQRMMSGNPGGLIGSLMKPADPNAPGAAPAGPLPANQQPGLLARMFPSAGPPAPGTGPGAGPFAPLQSMLPGGGGAAPAGNPLGMLGGLFGGG